VGFERDGFLSGASLALAGAFVWLSPGLFDLFFGSKQGFHPPIGRWVPGQKSSDGGVGDAIVRGVASKDLEVTIKKGLTDLIGSLVGYGQKEDLGILGPFQLGLPEGLVIKVA
jgi:hypothetical protein